MEVIMEVQVVALGLIDYTDALEIQRKLIKLRQDGKIKDTMLLLEHPPVITLGRRALEANILMPKEFFKTRGIDICEIERGGDVTYHGPGQLVGYPILNLNDYGRDVRQFVSNIEEIFIRLLSSEYGIDAGRNLEHTGVWVGDEKITAIGFAVKKWVTMHGFAFNVNTDMSHFNWIVPCGIKDKGVTSLQSLVDKNIDMNEIIENVIYYF
jgi:lipoyl(octanoyl) transferase